jgi:hypothetical protein
MLLFVLLFVLPLRIIRPFLVFEADALDVDVDEPPVVYKLYHRTHIVCQ